MNKLSQKPERGIPIPAIVGWIGRIVNRCHMVHPSPGRNPSPQDLGEEAAPPDSDAPSSRCPGAQDAGAGERHSRAALLVPAGRPPVQPLEHHGSAGHHHAREHGHG
jgi:hypothetical protein